MDSRLNISEVSSLLRDHWGTDKGISVRHVLVPNGQGAAEFKERWDRPGMTCVHMYGPGEIVGIDLDRDWERVSISENVSVPVFEIAILPKITLS